MVGIVEKQQQAGMHGDNQRMGPQRQKWNGNHRSIRMEVTGPQRGDDSHLCFDISIGFRLNLGSEGWERSLK